MLKFILLVTLCFINVNSQEFDPCVSGPCSTNEVCLMIGSDEYRCLNEDLFNLSFDPHATNTADYVDPCSTQPCEPNEMCINVSDFEYSCIGNFYSSENAQPSEPNGLVIDEKSQSVHSTTTHSPLFNEFIDAISNFDEHKAEETNSDSLVNQMPKVEEQAENEIDEQNQTFYENIIEKIETDVNVVETNDNISSKLQVEPNELPMNDQDEVEKQKNEENILENFIDKMNNVSTNLKNQSAHTNLVKNEDSNEKNAAKVEDLSTIATKNSFVFIENNEATHSPLFNELIHAAKSIHHVSEGLFNNQTLDSQESVKDEENFALDENQSDNACDPFPCKDDEICLSVSDSEYECSTHEIEEELEVDMEQTLPLKFKTNTTLVILNPCDNEPCKVDEKCVSLNNNDFVCVDSDMDVSSNPCLQTPCKIDEVCIMLDEEQFECVGDLNEKQVVSEQEARFTFEDEKAIMGNLLNEEHLREECRLSKQEQIPHPFSAHHFIQCKQDNTISVMECPSTLVFNAYLHRCDYSTSKPTLACQSNPCLNNGKCIDLANFQFKCACQVEFSGYLCERRHDPCFQNPCSFKGVCLHLPTQNAPYYCKCNFGKTYGLDCSRNAYINPCLSTRHDQHGDTYHPSMLNEQLFIQCHQHEMFMKFCPNGLVWSQQTKACVSFVREVVIKN